MRGVVEVKTGAHGNAVDIRLEMLLDEREIKNCVLRYCHGTDRLDWLTVAECYLPQATDDHGAFQGGPAEFASCAKIYALAALALCGKARGPG